MFQTRNVYHDLSADRRLERHGIKAIPIMILSDMIGLSVIAWNGDQVRGFGRDLIRFDFEMCDHDSFPA